MKRVPVTDALEARVLMINGWFELPDETKKDMSDVRAAAETFAKSLDVIFKRAKHDKGRAIASIDAIQHAKNIACDALILVHASKPEGEDGK